MKKALIVMGGWDGHEPRQCGEIAAGLLRKEGFDVELSYTLDSFLDAAKLSALDLIVPVWTMGTIANEQAQPLFDAVRSGVGLAGWHGGMCDAFRQHTEYQFMTGGQWVSHPGGIVDYTVNIASRPDPITAGIKDFKIKSEQYIQRRARRLRLGQGHGHAGRVETGVGQRQGVLYVAWPRGQGLRRAGGAGNPAPRHAVGGTVIRGGSQI